MEKFIRNEFFILRIDEEIVPKHKHRDNFLSGLMTPTVVSDADDKCQHADTIISHS
jgi:hypothetical protein